MSIISVILFCFVPICISIFSVSWYCSEKCKDLLWVIWFWGLAFHYMLDTVITNNYDLVDFLKMISWLCFWLGFIIFTKFMFKNYETETNTNQNELE